MDLIDDQIAALRKKGAQFEKSVVNKIRKLWSSLDEYYLRMGIKFLGLYKRKVEVERNEERSPLAKMKKKKKKQKPMY